MSNGIKGSSALLETPLKLTENRWDYIYWTIQLVWLLSRCCSSWQCCINLDWKAQSVRTEQTLCAAGVNEGENYNLMLNVLFGPCTSELLLLTAGLSGDRVALHDVIALSLLCTGADLSCSWLCCWFTPFVPRTAQRLKAYAEFIIGISKTFSCIHKCG